MKEIATPSRTREILNKNNFSLKKSLGQNFLVDVNVLTRIVQAAELDQETGVLEVGAGLGALTEQLAKQAGQVLSFELDQRLIPILKENLASYENVRIVHQDILKADVQKDIASFFDSGMTISVVANLPYYVTTPILFSLLNSGVHFKHMVFLMQKEVAQRLTASPGTKDYGSLSVAVQYYTCPQMIRTVPRTVFIPQPNVDSAVIKLTVREQPPVELQDEDFFFHLVKASFKQRRKTLQNNLFEQIFLRENKEVLQDSLQKIGIDGSRRGETLSLDEFAVLSNELLDKVPSQNTLH